MLWLDVEVARIPSELFPRRNQVASRMFIIRTLSHVLKLIIRDFLSNLWLDIGLIQTNNRQNLETLV